MLDHIRLFVFILCAVAILACNTEDTQSDQSIIGTWKLVEFFSDPGNGSGNWNKVIDGFEYHLKLNNQFTSNQFADCATGTYSVESDQLSLIYNCDGFAGAIEIPAGTFIYQFRIERDYLILNPINLSCVETCASKFEKLD